MIGVLVGVLLLAGAAFFFLRHRRQSTKQAAANTIETGVGPVGAEVEGGAGVFDDKDGKVFPYAHPPNTDSHTELPGYEAAHEVESPMNRPVEMQGEGYIDGQTAERAMDAGGPHEMEAGH